MVDHTSPKGTVFVTNVIRGSIAERVLLFADRILAIDDQKVTDKFTTKQAITEGLRSPKAEVTLLIERPVTCEALFAAANDFLVKH
ncbi:hypothetical protein AB6A40_009200 [Gnathostoma spinigerum]|uniref:PDZ domain-containing protein n=1 Tax=Gnathostoma spinigerum TaxID=75299 RepID=A0ABD6ERK7_9BILA